MGKTIIHLDTSTLGKFKEKDLSKYPGKTITERVSEMALDILDEQNYFINEFKGEYIDNIKNEVNKGISIESIFNIENIISIFLNKYFNINSFYFGEKYFRQLKNQNKDTFLYFFEENFLKEFYTFLLNINSFNIPIISTYSKEGGLLNGTLFGYLDDGKINFKFEYETSKEIAKCSFDNSEISGLMEEFKENQRDEEEKISKPEPKTIKLANIEEVKKLEDIYNKFEKNLVIILKKITSNKQIILSDLLDSDKEKEFIQNLITFLEFDGNILFLEKNIEIKKLHSFLNNILKNFETHTFEEIKGDTKISDIYSFPLQFRKTFL